MSSVLRFVIPTECQRKTKSALSTVDPGCCNVFCRLRHLAASRCRKATPEPPVSVKCSSGACPISSARPGRKAPAKYRSHAIRKAAPRHQARYTHRHARLQGRRPFAKWTVSPSRVGMRPLPIWRDVQMVVFAVCSHVGPPSLGSEDSRQIHLMRRTRGAAWRLQSSASFRQKVSEATQSQVSGQEKSVSSTSRPALSVRLRLE